MTLHEKLNLIQTKLEAPKDLYNKFGNYRYRSAESILAATKPFLREMGLTLVTESKISEHLNRIYVECTVTISDGKTSESASGMAREEETKKRHGWFADNRCCHELCQEICAWQPLCY